MNARDIMTSNPIHVREQTTLREVEERLYESDIRHIPVVRPNGELVGILSDRDLREYAHKNMSKLTAGEVMQSDVLMAYPDTDVRELIDLLLEYRVGAIPIVDPIEQQLVGIVSYIDLLRALQDHFDEM